MNTIRLVAAAAAITMVVAMLPSAHAESLRFRSEFIISKWSATIDGTLVFPKGTGPFPTVIFLHPCGGMTPKVREAMNRHASILNQNGFALLMLDSFSARGLTGGQACKGSVPFAVLTEDAFNAMAALRKNPKVDAENFFVAGQSLGGAAAIRAAIGSLSSRENAVVRAAAAWYPWCQINNGDELKSPLIVFGAGKDDWTPVDPCRQAKARGRANAVEYEVIVYPNSSHAFDQPLGRIVYKGHILAYDANATADARKRMVAFFKRHLKTTR